MQPTPHKISGRTLSQKLVSLEEHIQKWTITKAPQCDRIIQEYDSFFLSCVDGWKKQLPMKHVPDNETPFINPETSVTLHARSPGVFSANSSALNRFLSYVLLRTGILKLQGGALNAAQIKERVDKGFPYYQFRWEGSQVPETYDAIIVRHGVGDEYFYEQFPSVGREMAAQFKNFAQLQLIDGVPEEIDQYLRSL
jgi:hypothetical protein